VKQLLGRRPREAIPAAPEVHRGPVELVNDFYNVEAPSAQAAIDLFANDWSSVLPREIAAESGGGVRLFEAPWVEWFLTQVGSIEGQRVLELGPLECGHSSMLERAGARSVVAVEANSRAYLRCLIIKNLLDLDRTKLLFGDFVSYLESEPTFDLVLASGVLYHMENPLALLVLATRAAPTIMVWTHYYDPDGFDETILAKFDDGPTELVYDGHRATGITYRYGAALEWTGFCGGPFQSATWLRWPEIVRILDSLDFDVCAQELIATGHGPAAYFVAKRRA
jgi:hypothetical protein